MLEDFIAWYRKAYRLTNTDPDTIERNVIIIRDAFESCHAGFVVSKTDKEQTKNVK